MGDWFLGQNWEVYLVVAALGVGSFFAISTCMLDHIMEYKARKRATTKKELKDLEKCNEKFKC